MRLALVVLGVGAVWAAPAHPAAYLPAMGGDGGGQFIAPCPADQNLTGLELRAGDDIDAIRPLCVQAYDAHDVGAPVLTSGSGLVDTPGGLPGLLPQVAPGWYGGPGGGIQRLLCPVVTPIVLGADVEAEGRQDITVNNIHLFCGRAVASQTIPAAPAAIFDAPYLPPSGLLDQPRRQGSQRCPAGQVAVGVHGRAGKYLDAVGLICDVPRFAPRPPGSQAPLQLGRVQSTAPPGPPLSICDAAASARARNSPAAPGLEAQCRAQKPTMTLGRVKAAGPSGPPVPVCDAAGSARDRNSPAAPGLERQCLALGGHLPPRPGAPDTAALAAKGLALANDDPLAAELRNELPEVQRHGFDVGLGATDSDTAWGPGKQAALDALPPAEQEGFKVAASFAMDRNRNAALAAVGATIAAADAELAAARGGEIDARYWLGFDIATGIFGDPALGAKGNTATGPGSLAIRDALSAPAQRGFNASVTLHLGRHY